MPTNSGTIVVGIDGSEDSSHALDWAIEQARLERRPLTLVHALGTLPPPWTDVTAALPQQSYAAMRSGGQTVIDHAMERAADRAPDVVVQQVLEFADPRELLLEAGTQAAMVVVGSRGRGPIRSLLLGSVGVALARHSSCPVVVHRPWKQGIVRRGVLVAVDAGEGSRPVLELAYQQASLRQLPLTVLHVLDVPDELELAKLPHDESGDELAPERMILAEAMAGMGEKYPDVHVSTEVARGRPEVIAVSEGDRADLLVVGAHQGSRTEQLLFGSVSVAVVEHARCPVAVVPVGATGQAITGPRAI